MKTSIPLSLARHAGPVSIDTAGTWLILGDVHLPHHSGLAVKEAIQEAKRRKVKGILLNGDILDCAALSVHAPSRTDVDYDVELKMGEEFIAHFRNLFHKARIVYKSGNHEDRLDRFILSNASEFKNVKGISIPEFLGLHKYGVEWVQDCRKILMGDLTVIHGHEYKGGGGANPAKWLFDRAGDCTLCGHFHRYGEYSDRNITGYEPIAYAVGCACDLEPAWCPLNKWNHGYAIVELDGRGGFHVDNHRIGKHGTR